MCVPTVVSVRMGAAQYSLTLGLFFLIRYRVTQNVIAGYRQAH